MVSPPGDGQKAVALSSLVAGSLLTGALVYDHLSLVGDDPEGVIARDGVTAGGELVVELAVLLDEFVGARLVEVLG